MPTASSTQITRKTIRIATQAAIRYFILVIFRMARSHMKPVLSNRAPTTTKSDRVQFTSFVNCIAMSGMNNRITTATTIMIRLLFFKIINLSESVANFGYT